ncbi:MAG: hypothetical protein LH478_09305 [Chitinophagaceae bacterium]|nr:hypothetical protein [Chitinophagaceae bacterium]
MKISLLFFALIFLCAFSLKAQVTQINSNQNLTPIAPLQNGKLILVSDIDSTLWVTDGTLLGTLQLSNTITYKDAGSLLGPTYIFKGTTPATGIEVFKTDGTVIGTSLVSDINPTNASSTPDADFATLNGFVYFTAYRPAEGRELWRTDGSSLGTTLVKDIVDGPTGSNTTDAYHLFSNNTYLLLSVSTATEGAELWKSDGTGGGTIPLADINPGTASSNPDYFYPYNNLVIFQATDATHGTEYWKTNGTPGGTSILKDINPGPGNVYSFVNIPYPFRFNDKLFFVANDGVRGDEVWSTDGSELNTVILKDIQSAPISSTAIFNAVKVGNKFFFTSSDLNTRFEMWQSDGTPDGTTLFKAFSPVDFAGSPFIFPPTEIDFQNLTISQPLFQGNKFFFTAGTVAEGVELWVSDGTLPGTRMVKNIGPAQADGVGFGSFAYTLSNFYFGANNTTKGLELWKSDGTDLGTDIVADINPNAASSDPTLYYYVINGRLFFNASDNIGQPAFDLYVLEGVLPLPLHLLDFTVAKRTGDALVQWSTSKEINSHDFVVQRSDDGQNFVTIGTVTATGNSIYKSTYQFIDAAINGITKPRVYYRLQERGKDGSITYSKVITLAIIGNNAFTIKALGNPAKDVLPLQISSANEKIILRIVDAGGKLMNNQQTITGSGIVSLSLNGLKSGAYTLIAESTNERRIVRFVKQ